MASIIVVQGPNKGDYYPINKQRVTVGRLAECTIQLVDNAVSREHALIEYAQGASSITVTDRGSSHGDSVNGSKIDGSTQAGDGDEIELGESKLLFTTRDFPDRESALKDVHLKRWFGEDIRNTMM
ncbi:MAG: FHA domain-containing protein [Planctomycetota bacterium]